MMPMDKAQLVVKAAVAKAQEIGQPMNIAVVDAGANLTAFARMDGAWLGSVDIAINKAFTEGFRYLDVGAWQQQPTGEPVLRYPRIEPCPGDDLRGWHSDQGEWPDCRRRRR